MPYSKVKIYSDGSHFIAIPPKPSIIKRRKKPVDELIEVKIKECINLLERPPDIPELIDTGQVSADTSSDAENFNCPANMPDLLQNNEETTLIEMKDYFEELYKKYADCKKREKRNNIISDMRNYFDTYEQTAEFVDKNIERKTRNLICRRVRLSRKINLQEAGDGFNYFCTFTYDDKKHTENSFKKGLKYLATFQFAQRLALYRRMGKRRRYKEATLSRSALCARGNDVRRDYRSQRL